ncbi:hypothetical protein ACP8HI_08935 [Paenibacillus sp. FA6]|uniref:hypothetical protein n=1 Tax=Paenibacillus sp. FA6 TaxID=3413029 RepID=UPI003F655933
MAITLISRISSNLDVLHATKVSFRGNGLNLDVLIAPNGECWRQKVIIAVGVAAYTC